MVVAKSGCLAVFVFFALVLAAFSVSGPPSPVTAPPSQSDTAITGDAEKGKILVEEQQEMTNFACTTCHHMDSEDRLIGPGLFNISVRAATRVAGQSAYDYIHTSIVNPGAYIVDGFPDGLMPQIYGQIYTEDQINDIIAYLYTLK